MAKVKVHRLSIVEVKGGDAWSALEADLLAECRLGRSALLPGKADLPADNADPDRRVRAGLIRYLLLGGCDGEGGARPHPKGVRIIGGWIDGMLDLQGCRSQLDLGLQRCLLPERANLRDARLGALFLPGCAAPHGLDLHRLTTRGNVHLRAGFTSGATVDLGGARIDGQLSCVGGSFAASEGRALNCDAARIGADVFLSNGFRATAEVNFVGAEIGGQVACTGGSFAATQGWALNCNAARIAADVFLTDGFRATAEVCFVGAEIGGQVDCTGGSFAAPQGWALNCDAARIGADVFLRDCTATGWVDFVRAEVVGNLMVERASLEDGIDFEAVRVGHGLFWKSVTGARKVVNLTEARVGSLRDDRDSWEGVGEVILDGFRYDRLEGSMSVADRITWLGQARHRPRPAAPGAPEWLLGDDFDPQPHVQLATVLRAQGDRNGAARVLVDREARQRRASRLRAHARMDGTWRAGWLATQEDLKRPLDWLFWLLSGYGHLPMRALLASIVLVACAAVLAGAAYDAGQFAPNSDIILTSEAWLSAVAAHDAGGAMPLHAWLQSDTAQDYETFNPLLYGLDVFVPLDALGQEAAWRPSTGRGWLGEVAFYSRAFFQSAGWIITALAAAVLTGLVGRRD